MNILQAGALAALPFEGDSADAEAAETFLSRALDVLSMLAGALVGLAAGVVLALVLIFVIKLLSRRRDYLSLLARRAKTPLMLCLALIGVFTGLWHTSAALNDTFAAWLPIIYHALLICLILAVTWLVFQLFYLLEDIPALRYRDREPRHASRITTQAQVLRRVAQIVTIITGIVCVIYTFPGARLAMTSLVASAGVISLVAGLAAQSSLANMFAGIQLAMTDAIRVGDIVAIPSLDGATSQGNVEEITLTYVVVRLWDDRRIVVPSTVFTQKHFENLTRRHTQMLGSVELQVDWNTPVPMIRRKVDELLAGTDLWDGRTAAVQVTESTDRFMTVRVVVSAETNGDLWDLRCYMREHLIEWIRTEIPQALPRLRVLPQELVKVNRDMGAEEVAALAEELADLAGSRQSLDDLAAQVEGGDSRTAKPKSTGRDLVDLEDFETHPNDATYPDQDPTHRARLEAARLRSHQEVVRKSLLDRDQPQAGSDQRTQFMAMPVEPAETTGTQERLFSGSPDAEERAQIFAGPGERVLTEREEAARQKNQPVPPDQETESASTTEES